MPKLDTSSGDTPAMAIADGRAMAKPPGGGKDVVFLIIDLY